MILSEDLSWPPVPPEVSRATAEWDAWYNHDEVEAQEEGVGERVGP